MNNIIKKATIKAAIVIAVAGMVLGAIGTTVIVASNSNPLYVSTENDIEIA